MTDPINQPDPVQPPPPDAAATTGAGAQAADAAPAAAGGSATKWIIAAVAAVGAGALTVSGLMGPSKPVIVADNTPAAAADGTTPACKSDGKADYNFTVRDMNGASVKLSDFKGKVLLVNFWATWCPPCKAELPGLIELYDRYKDEGLVVLGISGDDDAETLRAFASEWKINYPMIVGRDEVALMDAYGPIYGYPISVIVGRDGALCGKHVGPATKEEFEREIKALL
jgi:peroxiredoxin